MYHNYCVDTVIITVPAKIKTCPQLQRSVQQQKAPLQLRSQRADISSFVFL